MTINADCLKVRAKVSESLRQINCLDATTDAWSSLNMDLYLSLTINFIDYDVKLRAKCLTITYFPEQCTGKLIFWARGLNFPKFPVFPLISIRHNGMF